MAKTDISSAFRILPVSTSSYKLLGFQLSGQYYFDRSLPMGCSVSCNTFEMFSTAIKWILTNRLNVTHMSHILADFMFFGKTGTKQCQLVLDSFLLLAKSIGLPISI